LEWAAYTSAWEFSIGVSIWLAGKTGALYPPNGIALPILLVDDAVVMSTVIGASADEIIIERDGLRWRLIPAPPTSRAQKSRFPGAEWIISGRSRDRSPVGF
jgi:hypothetical protein